MTPFLRGKSERLLLWAALPEAINREAYLGSIEVQTFRLSRLMYGRSSVSRQQLLAHVVVDEVRVITLRS